MDFSGNFGDILMWTFWFFCFFAFFWLLIVVFGDIFSDKNLGGGAKTLWILFVIFLPWLGILVYLIARGGGMSERAAAKARAQHEAQASYIKSVAGTTSASDQIVQAKGLLDSGHITQAEFDAIKAKALA